MLTVKGLLLSLLALVAGAYIGVWIKQARDKRVGRNVPRAIHFGIGFGTNFLDTLGIGSFATTTSLYKLWKLVPDELIPGTLNVGHALAAVAQSFIYITIVQVEMRTLVLMILAAVSGSWLGAAVVANLPRRAIQIGMGLALMGAALLMTMSVLSFVPGGGEALALRGSRLAVGLVGNFILGALMTLGIGLYAPCLILVSMLGMNPIAAFPIMMGSCAFLMPVASVQFLRKGRYAPAPAIGLTLGGIPAVLIAAYLVQSLPLDVVRWLVILVVIYTSTMMLRSATTEAAQADQTAPV